MGGKIDFSEWIETNFGVDTDTFIEVLEMSPGSQGGIQGAVSELELFRYLIGSGYEAWRIKEKPAGGFDEKKDGYKGDFLIKDNAGKYYVVECKGIKTNAEFRGGDTGDDFIKSITREQAFNTLKKYINIDKEKIYEKGLKAYEKKKADWESKHPGETYPPFAWTHEHPGPDSPDLTKIFPTLQSLHEYIDSLDESRFSEQAFRKHIGAFVMMQTHKPNRRKDPETGESIAAPLASDFSILAVDLFQRTGKHQFVFVNPDTISHSPEYPNHLYQNYTIDILIPGKKDNLDIVFPWFINIEQCIKATHPRTVAYDESQLDHREDQED